MDRAKGVVKHSWGNIKMKIQTPTKLLGIHIRESAFYQIRFDVTRFASATLKVTTPSTLITLHTVFIDNIDLAFAFKDFLQCYNHYIIHYSHNVAHWALLASATCPRSTRRQG
jgi:hypothetical protein